MLPPPPCPYLPLKYSFGCRGRNDAQSWSHSRGITGKCNGLQSSGDSGANVKRLEQETESKILQLKEQSSRVSRDVGDMLLRQVTTVKN
ncbi:V-type proton ATPase subunit G1-like [Asparagus officinalis]|uniref:V-type proton ATPase subunit G1-like n=1 Tax=Asparagus officinalis TaxID=4686 RepID=UPI00098E4E3B|nr:V-type proton ATPase subunit G1-like [Asparagus officinalis]XP_020259475.1 V-type proton ATPase subunit G1-like [Asparagus officinalis]XP_020259658.1 V-type proton ATPase subunit G1-like [Asparagus officinalis]